MRKGIFRLALVLWIAIGCVGVNAADAVPGPKIGAYLGGGCDGFKRVPAFETWLGRKVDVMVDFLAADSWSAMVSTASWVGDCWKSMPSKVVISIPMLPRDQSSTLADGVDGAYDQHFRNIATILANKGHGNAVIRIGWEFNASWFPWSSTKTPVAYVNFWRRIVSVMRDVPNTSFRFDWCPVLGSGVASPEPAYPGDDVVDVIGADIYNVNYSAPGTTPAQRWKYLLEAPFGLQWHKKFAAAHGKPMSYPEWGTGTRPDGHGGGDDPVFMAGMTQWIQGSQVEYHGYWDYKAPDFNARLSDGSQPLSAAIYLESFGGPR
jgi:hypothetical protein